MLSIGGHLVAYYLFGIWSNFLDRLPELLQLLLDEWSKLIKVFLNI